jgi:hypothetical protein
LTYGFVLEEIERLKKWFRTRSRSRSRSTKKWLRFYIIIRFFLIRFKSKNQYFYKITKLTILSRHKNKINPSLILSRLHKFFISILKGWIIITHTIKLFQKIVLFMRNLNTILIIIMVVFRKVISTIILLGIQILIIFDKAIYHNVFTFTLGNRIGKSFKLLRLLNLLQLCLGHEIILYFLLRSTK